MPYEAKTNWKYDDTVTEKDLNRIEQGLKDAHVAEYKDITLKPGVQIVDVPEDTPFRMGEIRGRTLINLLGHSWSAYGGKMSFGDGVYTIEGSGTVPNPQLTANLTSAGLVPKVGDLLFLRSKCRVDNTICKEIGLYFYSKNTDRNYAAKITKPMANQVFVIGGVIKVTQAMIDDWANLIVVVAYEYNSNGDALDTVNKVAEVAMYQVPESVNGLPVSELLASYPYVDSMTNVTSPYVIGTSGNLLPPFTKWRVINEKGLIEDPYAYRQQAYSSGEWTNTTVSVDPNTNYSLYFEGTNGIRIRVTNIDESVHLLNSTTSSASFNSGQNKEIKIYIFADVQGTVTNPILTPTSVTKPFVPQLRSIWAAECQLAANPLDGSNADVLYVGDDSLPCVHSWWEKVIVDINRQWQASKNFDDMRQILTPNFANVGTISVDGMQYLTKYDGRLLKIHGQVNAPDTFHLQPTTGYLYIGVSNKDSGWGKDYDPTEDEIKAYLLGWRMYDNRYGRGTPYNLTDGTGHYKAFCKITDTSVDSGTLNVAPTTSYPEWTPYRLQYLKAKPTVEPVRNYETGLTFDKGWNMIEVGSGIVIRESAKPTHYLANGNFYINNTAVSGSLLKNKVSRMLRVYRNGQADNTAKIENDVNAYGKQHVRFLPSDFDPTAVYHVIYTMLDSTLAAPISSRIASNLRGTVTDVVQWTSNAERRLSVVENVKVDKYGTGLIKITTLNGYAAPTNYPDYLQGLYARKDSAGCVWLYGLLTGGTVGEAIAILPKGFRPKQSLTFTVPFYYITGGESATRIKIYPTGIVSTIKSIELSAEKGEWISLHLPPFLAEQ